MVRTHPDFGFRGRIGGSTGPHGLRPVRGIGYPAADGPKRHPGVVAIAPDVVSAMTKDIECTWAILERTV
jgi:hypothetical protein